MKKAFYIIFFRGLLRLPDVFFALLFAIIHPIYKVLHRKRAYGRVARLLEYTGFSANADIACTTGDSSHAVPALKSIVAKDVFRNLYWNGLDSYRLLAGFPSATGRVLYENEDILKDALESGPVVAISIHQGAFENLHRSLCRYSEHVHLITSPFKSSALTEALREIRGHRNLHEYSTEEVATVLRSLFKTKGILAMVVDQARDARGNAATLFGKPSTLYLRLPAKANQMGASIVTFRTWSEKAKGSNGKTVRLHRVRFEHRYAPDFDKLQGAAHAERSPLVDSIAKEIELWIAEHPEQWTWNYHGNFRSPTQSNTKN